MVRRRQSRRAPHATRPDFRGRTRGRHKGHRQIAQQRTQTGQRDELGLLVARDHVGQRLHPADLGQRLQVRGQLAHLVQAVGSHHHRGNLEVALALHALLVLGRFGVARKQRQRVVVETEAR